MCELDRGQLAEAAVVVRPTLLQHGDQHATKKLR